MKTEEPKKYTKDNPKPLKAVVEIEPNPTPFGERMLNYLKKKGVKL